jgi:hypothetical protein
MAAAAQVQTHEADCPLLGVQRMTDPLQHHLKARFAALLEHLHGAFPPGQAG